MTDLLIETQCLPPVPTFEIIRQKNIVRIEAQENYQKRSFRNRFNVLGPNGIEVFTIPLTKGKNQKMKIDKVEIAYDEEWVRDLSRMMQTNYGSAPYYQHYIDALLSIFSKKEHSLLNLNMDLLEWTMRVLQIETVIQSTTEYMHHPNPNFADLRNKITPRSILTMESDVIYNQVYEEKHGFIPNLSIIDMIMCCGPETAYLLQSK